MISDNYIIDTAYLYFTFESSITIEKMIPSEGFIQGGNTVSVYGNLTYFYNRMFDIYLGEKLVPKPDVIKIMP